MCLSWPDQAGIRRATRPILVTKYLDRRRGQLYSPYRDQLYEVGKLYASKMSMARYYGDIDIERGLHAYYNKYDRGYGSSRFNAVIPEGAYFCFDRSMSGHIASTHLMVIKAAQARGFTRATEHDLERMPVVATFPTRSGNRLLVK